MSNTCCIGSCDKDKATSPYCKEHDEGNTLHWVCLTCNSTWDMAMPGFPGGRLSGQHRHYIRGNLNRSCGPLIATMKIG